jgi:hypothetical protein
MDAKPSRRRAVPSSFSGGLTGGARGVTCGRLPTAAARGCTCWRRRRGQPGAISARARSVSKAARQRDAMRPLLVHDARSAGDSIILTGADVWLATCDCSIWAKMQPPPLPEPWTGDDPFAAADATTRSSAVFKRDCSTSSSGPSTKRSDCELAPRAQLGLAESEPPMQRRRATIIPSHPHAPPTGLVRHAFSALCGKRKPLAVDVTTTATAAAGYASLSTAETPTTCELSQSGSVWSDSRVSQ